MLHDQIALLKNFHEDSAQAQADSVKAPLQEQSPSMVLQPP